MNDKQTINAETLEKLRRQLINRIEQTDDATVLSRCIAVMDTALISEQQDDELQEEELSSLELPSDEEPVTDQPRHTSLARHMLLLTVFILLGGAAYVLFTYLHNNQKQEQTMVTVATDYETIEVNGCKFNMVKVEGGTFTMGATPEMDDYDNDERPTFQVTLSSYTIGETEVTQGLWYAVMGERPASPDGDDHPMKEVSHDECQAFIAKLNKLTGRHFHLPTEAQWEYAARGGKKSKHYRFAGSNNIDEVAWYSANSWDLGKGNPGFGNHAVGMKKPNELGLYDMSGNVWEWCLDSYEHFDETAKTNPGLNESVHSSFRCNRGGSWDYIATSARVSNRRQRTRDFRNFNLGFRLSE